MKVYYGLRSLRRPLRNPIVTIGAFDGIHKAHRFILRQVIQRARQLRGSSVLLTFDPHPSTILHPERPFSALTCIEHRLYLLSALGLDACMVLKFTRRFSLLSAGDFIQEVLVKKLGVRELWVGSDYVFGKNREGNIRLLRDYGKRYGFGVREIPEIKFLGRRTSSTQIRIWVAQGKLKEASLSLGRPYSLYGKVVKGCGRGRLLGFPTANLKPYHEAIPPRGVYVVKVFLHRGQFGKRPQYLGILNIGNRPTFGRNRATTLEVHLLGFQGDLYGRKIEVSFLKRLRPERKFSNKEALVSQIRRDTEAARSNSSRS